MNFFIKFIFISFIISDFSVFAIAPPEFILNITQNVLQFMGILFAFIFSVLFHLKLYLKQLFINQNNFLKLFLISIFITSIFTSIYYAYLKTKEKKWKKNVKTEMKEIVDNLNEKNEIWQKYIKISSSDEEQTTAKLILSQKLAITPQKYLELKENNNILVVDLRERISYERGSIPGSIHIRFADLLNGEWKTLPLNYDYIIFLCWIGTSGNLATEFLNTMGIKNVLCFANGVQDIYDNPLISYKGEYPIKIPKKMNEYLTLAKVSKYLSDGYITLDIRPYDKYKSNGIPNSIWFFYEAMTTEEIEKTLNLLDKNKKYFALCDSELSCWLAKVVGLELEKRNLHYLGRYTPNKKLRNRKEGVSKNKKKIRTLRESNFKN